MTTEIQERLIHHETALLTGAVGIDQGWTVSGWPAAGSQAGMRVDRIHRAIGDDRLMLHRFWPDEGEPNHHTHPFALAAHVLGPGCYEVRFQTDSVCHVRAVFRGEMYYEMRTPEVQHSVIPVEGPVYSVAICTPFLPRPQSAHPLPPRLHPFVAEYTPKLRAIVERFFDHLYPEAA